MKLNLDALRMHLETHWSEYDCCVCGSAKWAMPERAYELRPFHAGDGPGEKGVVFPVVPVTCRVCGNIHFLNAISSGAIEPPTRGSGEHA